MSIKFLLVPEVALRKESVDRNCRCSIIIGGNVRVALRKESVDRNESKLAYYSPSPSRSP